MQYFDLNIPYLESDEKISDKKSKKENRLQTIIKSIELGYSGIAYNRTIKGLMKQSDGCTIPPFPPSSLSSYVNSLSSSVAFRRKLLGVVENDVFRQYKRLTVVVEADAQSAALNSGNPVLKSYDLVAVRPLSQKCFDHACESAQVDMISIDFSEKVPFRLKLPMVKMAITRGVYFEIAYSSLLDVQVRREAISNAKLLVEWTNGKNLIVSSAAPSVKELRGPNDISNLLYLLGLTTERAKATLSKNCRLLIANALKKKQFFKEAIRVEMMPAGAQTRPKEPWIVDYLNWDPLSSGEGDLLLEDLAKSFAESGKALQSVKAIDFTSLIDNVPSHGNQVSDSEIRTESKFPPSDNLLDLVLSSENLEVPQETRKRLKEPTPPSTSLVGQNSNAEEIPQQALLVGSPIESDNVSGFGIFSASTLGELNKSDVLGVSVSPMRFDEPEMQDRGSNHAEGVVVSGCMRETTCADIGPDAEYGSISVEGAADKVEDLSDNSVQAYSRPLGSNLLNKTEGEILVEGDQSNSLVCFDVSLGSEPLQLKQDPSSDAILPQCTDKVVNMDFVVERDSSEGLVVGDIHRPNDVAKELEQSQPHLENLMDVVSVTERNKRDALVFGDLPYLKEVPRVQAMSEENHSEDINDTKESHLTDMQVDSFQQEIDGDANLVTKSRPNGELNMERKQVEEFVTAEHQSLSGRKLGSQRVKQSAFLRVPRFPLKHFLQAQFKRKGRKSVYKAQKRN